jgi:hypothetical protein
MKLKKGKIVHPYRENIDNSTRTKLKVNDVVSFKRSEYLPKMYLGQIGIIVERYRTLNRFNKQFWNYFARVKLLTGQNEGRQRSFCSGGFFMKKLKTISVSSPKIKAIKTNPVDGEVYYAPLLDSLDLIGSSFSAYLNLTYDQIVEIFEESNCQPERYDKIDWCWDFYLNCVPLSIYNYKTGPSYCKENKNVKPEDIKRWHIGSHNLEALDLLDKYIRSKKVLISEPLIYDLDYTLGGIKNE